MPTMACTFGYGYDRVMGFLIEAALIGAALVWAARRQRNVAETRGWTSRVADAMTSGRRRIGRRYGVHEGTLPPLMPVSHGV